MKDKANLYTSEVPINVTCFYIKICFCLRFDSEGFRTFSFFFF